MVLCKICGKNVYTLCKEMCDTCYQRDYRKKNKEKLNNWAREYYQKNKIRREYNAIREKTRKMYPITSKAKCTECNSKDKLSHHHYRYTTNPEDWDIVCEECHLRLDTARKKKLKVDASKGHEVCKECGKGEFYAKGMCFPCYNKWFKKTHKMNRTIITCEICGKEKPKKKGNICHTCYMREWARNKRKVKE